MDQNLGTSEYSYFFVLEYFRSMLERFGADMIVIDAPQQEADVFWEDARRRGERCVLLSFAPPHRTFLNLRCPTIPIFAWEFDTLPNEVWGDDQRNDWRYVLADIGQAITHSRYSLDAVKRAMGDQFPVLAIPAPVFERANSGRGVLSGELAVSGHVLDSTQGRFGMAPPPPAP